jgi:hypothetical protein
MGWLDWWYRYNYDGGIKSFWSWLNTSYRLNQANLGEAWWTLTITSRKDIARKIVQAYCASLPSKLQMRPNSTAPWATAYCLGRSILQATILGNMLNFRELWLAEWNCWGEARSYFLKTPIKLPVHVVDSICVEKNWFHSVSGIQIDKDLTKISSWMFFSGQSGVIPADGSNSQIPHGTTLTVQSNNSNVIQFTIGSFGPVRPVGVTVIAKFNIP